MFTIENTEREFEEVNRKFHLLIIREVDERIEEEIQNDPKSVNWFDVQLKDGFPTFMGSIKKSQFFL